MEDVMGDKRDTQHTKAQSKLQKKIRVVSQVDNGNKKIFVEPGF